MDKKYVNYSDHFDTLVALVSHMALMDYLSRTPSNLAKFLSLEYEEVNFVLKNFKGLFRESINPVSNSGKEEKYYCLQIRYATRQTRKGEEDDIEEKAAELRAEYLTALLEFISKMVDIERAGERQISANRFTLGASILAFIASIVAVIANYVAK